MRVQRDVACRSDGSLSLAIPVALFPAFPPPAPTLAPTVSVNVNVNSSPIQAPRYLPALPSPTLPTSPSPVTLLSQGLSTLPSLFTISTQLPKEWNDVLLTVSKNERLEKILLRSARPTATPGSKKMSSDASAFGVSPQRGRTGSV
ncbi:hypothetical protein D9758_016599 [Tetrapyrgos nigripes]|uniref:Uncharacterized protein n=1 Tax=Tetrapyrgos nigripes TaxID=182062 RepID=A0A8H5FKS2_9AGAR|nr:hypothetical protein D9758_016599 [Tetrapyrgos nigripes]